MHNYRRLRQRNLKLENQAVGILDDQDSHKIVMDVFDFMKGDVTVQLVKGKELLVEGQAERQDGGRVSRVSFVRRFALPELVERDAISCVLSSDGILTITCRKRASGYSARGFCSERKPHVDTAGGWRTRMRRTPSRIGKEPVLGPSAAPRPKVIRVKEDRLTQGSELTKFSKGESAENRSFLVLATLRL
nr:alpha-crystallin A chain-like [Penaeus vannamei]